MTTLVAIATVVNVGRALDGSAVRRYGEVAAALVVVSFVAVLDWLARRWMHRE